MNIHELEKGVIEEINERSCELKESDYPSDLLFEIADSFIPIFNHELASCLANNPDLAFVDDEGLVDVSKGIYHIIAVAIFERLIQVAHETYENLTDNADTEEIDLITVVRNICDPQVKTWGCRYDFN